MIYHVTTQASWDAAQESGWYSAPSLATEGFIHCSDANQVAGVLERYYQGQTGLILLHIHEALLSHPLKYEETPSTNELFPHVYGEIDVKAVEKVESI